MILIRWYIGTEKTKDDYNIPLAVVSETLEQAASAISGLFGGCTQVNGMGSWIGPDKRLVTERCAILEAVVEPPPAKDGTDNIVPASIYTEARFIAKAIAFKLNQSEVMVTTTRLDSIMHVGQEV